MQTSPSHASSAAASTATLTNARRDAVVVVVLVTAVLLLIWNGSVFFSHLGRAEIGTNSQLTGTALALNVALILFGWRRYVDLQHEAELRADGERRAVLLATTDHHTGLLNRKGFADRAQALAATAAANRKQLVILSVQINRFKSVNDRHGYEVGDELLRSVSGAMVQTASPDAVVGRLSGDEFAIALALPAEAMASAEQLGEALLRTVTKPFAIGERMLQVGGFIGIAASGDRDVRIPDLLRRADIAMNHATSGRVARPVWFDAGMERALIAYGEIEQGIRYGLDHEQFVPYFEPQVDLATGDIIGFEVLARWIHPLSGVIGPETFIPVAEENGLIGRLSERVIEQALFEAADWDPSIKISVNISPAQLADSWLAERIVRLLTITGFPAERLVVEITESSLFADIDLARSIVSSLKNQGIRLALDDFGTGFSSLAHLRSLPFDMIKIDRSFVSDIQTNRESMAIVRAVSTLANALNVPVCVEGIEEEAVLEAVSRLGCAVGQGWYFGKAVAADQALQMLAQRGAADLSQPRHSAAN